MEPVSMISFLFGWVLKFFVYGLGAAFIMRIIRSI